MSDTGLNIAVVGAAGLVGETLVSLLAERDFPVADLFLLDHNRAVGKKLLYGSRSIAAEDLTEFDFSRVDLALFCAGEAIARDHAPLATSAGALVIDGSATFRLDPEVPLILPEVNPDDAADYTRKGIVAAPSSSVTQLLLALKPIYDAVGVDALSITTYQSVSGTGAEAVEELARQTALLMNGKSIEPAVYPRRIAFNVLPQVGPVEEQGYTRDELMMVWETRKILHDEEIRINPTAARVPVFYGDAAALYIETEREISPATIRDLLESFPGVELQEGADNSMLTAPADDAGGSDRVFVGRIRQDLFNPHRVNLWTLVDNVRKGAATNIVQIAEILVKHYL